VLNFVLAERLVKDSVKKEFTQLLTLLNILKNSIMDERRDPMAHPV
jgi:hypothetical protein